MRLLLGGNIKNWTLILFSLLGSVFSTFIKLWQNVHLVAKWLPTLEKKLEQYSSGSHDAYRVYISAEPAPSADSHVIPHGILEAAIKITNEAPTGMYANLHKALDNFNQVRIFVVFMLLKFI